MADTVQAEGEVEQLYQASRQRLTAYFQRRHRSAEAAEDLLHETFLQLMRRVDRCRAARSPQAYLFGIARHVSAEAWRRAQRQATDEASLLPAEAPNPEPRLLAAREVIAGLPSLQREILDLRFQHDLSYAEIAEVLNVPVGTVRSRLHNAMRLLRERLEANEI